MIDCIKAYWQKHPEWHKDAWRIIRFGITGVLSTALHYAAYLLALQVVNPTISYSFGYCVGLIFNYFMTTHFTFKEPATKRNAAGFLGSHAINYLLEIGLLNLLLLLGIGKQLAGILTLVLVVPINWYRQTTCRHPHPCTRRTNQLPSITIRVREYEEIRTASPIPPQRGRANQLACVSCCKSCSKLLV